MLHKNSPMTPVLRQGVERLREIGVEQDLFKLPSETFQRQTLEIPANHPHLGEPSLPVKRSMIFTFCYN